MTTRQNRYQIMTEANRCDCRRSVINERKTKLKVFSPEGIRTDIVIVFFAIIVMLVFGQLSADISSLSSADSYIRKTTSMIETLKVQNEQYRVDAALAAEHPILAYDPYEQAFLIRMTVPDSESGLSYYMPVYARD